MAFLFSSPFPINKIVVPEVDDPLLAFLPGRWLLIPSVCHRFVVSIRWSAEIRIGQKYTSPGGFQGRYVLAGCAHSDFRFLHYPSNLLDAAGEQEGNRLWTLRSSTGKKTLQNGTSHGRIMAHKVNSLGQRNRLACPQPLGPHEMVKFLLLACCYQQVARKWWFSAAAIPPHYMRTVADRDGFIQMFVDRYRTSR